LRNPVFRAAKHTTSLIDELVAEEAARAQH
jgi:hypothetical protein